MRISEEKKIEITKKIETKCFCDICGNEIIGPYFRVVTGHDDWGNDSIDSIEYFDICSDKCIQEKINIFLSECCRSNTQHIEIRQEYFSSPDNRYKIIE